MISRVLLFYANALMKLGARKHLEQEDLWDVAPQHQAAHLFQQYSAAMRKTARPERFPHVRMRLLPLVLHPFALDYIIFTRTLGMRVF